MGTPSRCHHSFFPTVEGGRQVPGAKRTSELHGIQSQVSVPAAAQALEATGCRQSRPCANTLRIGWCRVFDFRCARVLPTRPRDGLSCDRR